MVELVESELGGGNTITPPKPRISASNKWCFTYNNYPVNAVVEMVAVFDKFDYQYIIGKEVGEQGTPHLQGFVCSKQNGPYFRPMERFKGLMSNTIHWEKCKGTRLQNIEYCSKEGDYVTNLLIARPVFCPVMWGWQLGLIELIKDDPPPENRKIIWCHEPDGCMGKSNLAKYLIMRHNALITCGKSGDMKYSVIKYTEVNDVPPKLIVIDVPRAADGHFAYQSVEELSNGAFCSPKYESMQFIMNRPHIVVLANFPPSPGVHMSADRFHIIEISNPST